MEMIQDSSHIPEHTLEEYALGRLPTREVPVVFEHLLVCDECNERYEAELTFREELSAAMTRTAGTGIQERKRSWFEFFAFPKPVWAAVAALVVLAGFLPVLQQTQSPVQVVSLSAVRGGQAVSAPARSSLELRLDTTGLDTPNPVQVQIVNASGTQVWRGMATATGRHWRVQPDKQLKAGLYWVRVVNPAQATEPLREFELNLR